MPPDDPSERETFVYMNPERGLYCIDCGYRLDKHEGNICPECGRPYDIDDAMSVDYRRRGSARKWVKAAGSWALRGYILFLALMIAILVFAALVMLVTGIIGWF